MESKNQNISPEAGKIKYKAEPARHFPRYKIPAYIEIEGKRYRLKDWSLGGCSIYNLPENYLQKKWTVANIIIPFDVFDTIIKDINVEFIRKYDNGTVGCKFSELKPAQASLLQDIVEAYLEGSIVSVDGFINTIKREDLREALDKARPQPPQKKGIEEIIRKFFILSLFMLVTLTLVIFLVYAIHTRIFMIKATSASISSNIKVIRTPASGVFQIKKGIMDNESVKKMEILGILRTVVGIPIIIRSPIQGKILNVFVSEEGPVKEGDPLFEILPSHPQLYVVANILHRDTERLRILQSARIILPDGTTLNGIVEKIISPVPAFMINQPNILSLSSVSYDKVILKIPGFKNTALIGSSVSVIFDLTPEFIKHLITYFQ